uniref:Protein arginine N-methyltransferase 5 n=2 Tax=Caenorhabditis japonica TaxID=281687 RepID=A0A8R1ING5_CAEJA
MERTCIIREWTIFTIFSQGHVINNMDQIYVVYLSKYIPLFSSTKPVFTFEHPNFTNSSNERSATVEFDIDRKADLMGFGGYFDLQLYKNVMLSIEPSTHTPGMVSWFPAVIPLRDQLRVGENDKIRLKIDRKEDAGGVWYEWHVEQQ